MLLLTALLALSPVERPGQAPTDKELRNAARRGATFLSEAEGDDVELRLMAVVDADGFVPRRLVDAVLAVPPASVRSAALQGWALARVDPWLHRPRIAHCIQLILDTQTEDGFWSAGAPVEAPRVLALGRPKIGFDAPRERLPLLKLAPRATAAGKGSPEHAAWAGFGLKGLESASIQVPGEVMERAAAAWSGEGLDAVDVVAWRSAFLHWAGTDFRKDAVVLAALERLKAAPFPTSPRDLARLHTAMMHLYLEKLGEREWFRDGAKALLSAQKEDGSWGDVESTAWAVYFLPGSWPLGVPRPGGR